ncbi:Hypothetical protein PENO1_099190 [Penicillium occitanis (nom. inval.)]|nr:Hypothetical protein PENO1_099190 [Penicillium occitanis (nom. inval.)]PCG90881.1 hypothetical protein PENOC_099900 [Penicillium occitanis (nom. inval.)]
MASSNSVSSSVAKYRFFGELEGGVTFILHNAQDKTILVESDAGITIFLAESEVKSRQIDPRQYHWHCILKDDEFHFRNAFSKNMLQTDAKSYFDDSDLGPGELVVTGKFNKKEGGFRVLPGSDDEQFTLYHTFQGRLFPISVGYEDHFKFKYPRTCWDINLGPVVQWKFESFYKWMIGDVELEYSRDDFKL